MTAALLTRLQHGGREDTEATENGLCEQDELRNTQGGTAQRAVSRSDKKLQCGRRSLRAYAHPRATLVLGLLVPSAPGPLGRATLLASHPPLVTRHSSPVTAPEAPR